MSLTELLAGVEDHEKTLTVFNGSDEAVAQLRRQFADRNLAVRAESTATDEPGSFAVLSEDGSFVTAASLADVRAEPDMAEPGFEADAYSPILDHLDETLFTSYDTQQMIAASREIEDRAWRLGEGQLHAGFQALSILASELDVYRRLADRGGLEVHAYAAPDGEVPDHGSDLTVHVERAAEIERCWFVAYDGAGVDVNKCALLAQEREPGSFYGFWTYDPDTVDWIVDYLTSTYGLIAGT